jgi:import receptor subunit TOM70
MDDGKLDEALTLFDTALGLDPNTTDALLHRSNLRTYQQKVEEAKKDLERCIELRPDHTLARLRLAALLMIQNDTAGAKAQLDLAEQYDPNSSEVHSYRGEMCFTQNEMEDAKKHFEKAMECEPGNPTPYVNAALTIMNTPPTQGVLPDIAGAIALLEKAIEVDPHFHSAYAQLGQLRLSMATDLTAAREVITLYDKGIEHCRSPEELKEIVSMRLLTVAQVDAASMLGMETFSMQ